MPATLKQIASQAKLDISTVSRVLNRPDTARVSDKTRQRVKQMANNLGYHVNSSGQSLARGQTGCIGVLIPDVTDTVLSKYLQTINKLLDKSDLQTIPFVTGWHPEGELKALDALPKRQVDAIINLNFQEQNLDEYERLRELGHTLIFRAVDREIGDLPVDCVGIDISDGYQRLVNHLNKRGYQKIGIVGGFVSQALADGTNDNPAANYVRSTFKQLGQTLVQSQAVPCPQNTAEEACLAITSILKKEPNKFDALIVQSNKLLPGVRKALWIANKQVPSQMGLATISDSEVCRLMDVPVTVWDQPIKKICKGLVNILKARLEGRENITNIQYESKLIERQSTKQRHSRKGGNPDMEN